MAACLAGVCERDEETATVLVCGVAVDVLLSNTPQRYDFGRPFSATAAHAEYEGQRTVGDFFGTPMHCFMKHQTDRLAENKKYHEETNLRPVF